MLQNPQIRTSAFYQWPTSDNKFIGLKRVFCGVCIEKGVRCVMGDNWKKQANFRGCTTPCTDSWVLGLLHPAAVSLVTSFQILPWRR